MQLAQLFLIDLARCLRQQVLRALRLRKRYYIADRFGASHHRHEPVESERDSAVRWSAVLQGIQQKPEFGARFFRADFQRAKHLALHVFTVDANRAAADFPAVEHPVVRLGDRLRRIGREMIFMPVLRAGKRMMRGDVPLRFLVELEHREVDDP